MDAFTELSLAKFRTACANLQTALAAAERAALELHGKMEATAGSVEASPRVCLIQTTVAEHFGMTRDRMLQRDRHWDVARARMTAMLMCREFTSFGVQRLGMEFGGLNHGTVSSACFSIKRLAESDPRFAHQLETVRGKVAEALGRDA